MLDDLLYCAGNTNSDSMHHCHPCASFIVQVFVATLAVAPVLLLQHNFCQ